MSSVGLSALMVKLPRPAFAQGCDYATRGQESVVATPLTYVHVGKARLAANGLSPLQEAKRSPWALTS
jgi:hypothetical protein